jgi:pimeloyl-ACP methyl ester carboxylesterase
VLFASAEAHWDRHVSGPQRALREFLASTVATDVFHHPFKTLFGRLLLLARARVVPFAEDILAYQRRDAREKIHGELEDALARLTRTLPSTETLSALTVVGHSLGTVIASDFLWDRREERGGAIVGYRLGRFRLANFYTLGSPMAFYALRYGVETIAFDKPIRVPQPGCWVNIYHLVDPVATPLRPLNPAFREAVLQDAEIRNASLSAHTSYWNDRTVHQIIGLKLALDWLRRQPPSALDVEALQRRYETTLRIA